MTTDAATATQIVAANAAPTPAFRRQALVAHFLESLEAKTREEYGRALQQFVAFAAETYGLDMPAEQVVEHWFLALPDGGHANEATLRWRTELNKTYAPKTVNQRLSALRSVVKLAKTLGRVAWTLDIRGVDAPKFKDTRGPGHVGYKKLLQANEQKHGDSPLGRRNKAMLRLMFDLALRKDSVLSLRLCDVSVKEDNAGEVRPLFKKRGRHDSCREPRSLPEGTRKALAAWLEVHPLAPLGGETDPLFVGLDRNSTYGPLSAKGAWEVVRDLGLAAGIKAYPHGLRHAAGTHALDVFNGDIRKVQKFMGHANPATTMIYDDNRKDLAGEVARGIAGD